MSPSLLVSSHSKSLIPSYQSLVTIFLFLLFHLIGRWDDLLHDTELSCPKDEEYEGDGYDRDADPKGQVNDDERSAGEESRQRVHDEHDLLLIQPLGQQTVMQVVFIR